MPSHHGSLPSDRIGGRVSLKELRLLLPGMRQSGGLFVALRFAELMDKIFPSRVFTYVDKVEGFPFVDLRAIPHDEEIIWVITWGPHVNRLIQRLGKRKIIYYAQSTCWGSLRLSGIPILCISRFVMSHFAEYSPYSPLYLAEPVLDQNCRNIGLDRDIDVLYLSRKSTQYLDRFLVPRLQKECHVHIQKNFIPPSELYRLYNRSKVYLYSSQQPPFGLGDGFGLQPLEAIVCGCSVFSNLHGGLSDYLDPGICGHKLATHSLEYDVNRILKAVKEYRGLNPRSELLREKYSTESFNEKIRAIWPEILEFLETTNRTGQAPISNLSVQGISVINRAKKWATRASSKVLSSGKLDRF